MPINNTKKIFDILKRPAFICQDSSDSQITNLFNDIAENYEEYVDYFKQIGLFLESGDGYYFFSRLGESNNNIKQKLITFGEWLDYYALLVTFKPNLMPGEFLVKPEFLEATRVNPELKDMALKLIESKNISSLEDIVDKILNNLVDSGFAELSNLVTGRYKILSTMNYVKCLIDMITLNQNIEQES